MVVTNTLPFPHFGGYFLPAKLGGAANTQGYTKRTSKKNSRQNKNKIKNEKLSKQDFFWCGLVCKPLWAFAHANLLACKKKALPSGGRAEFLIY